MVIRHECLGRFYKYKGVYSTLVLDFLEPGKFKDYRQDWQQRTSRDMFIIHSLHLSRMHWIITYPRGAFGAVHSDGKGSFQGLKKWSEQLYRLHVFVF